MVSPTRTVEMAGRIAEGARNCMGRLTITIFYDPKASDSKALVERMAIVAPSLHVGVTYVDITKDKTLLKNYKDVAPIGTVAGTIVFSGGLDEQMLRGRLKRIKR